MPGLKPKFFALNTCLNLIRGFSPMGIIRIKLTWRGMGKIFLQNSSIMFNTQALLTREKGNYLDIRMYFMH
jgi:hypothetical protein